jgi:NAD(P)-dependent dehydrogenase (short-subunit alcohol dehydrogenase family)
MIEKVPENIKENILKQIPIKRFGKPEEILSGINFIINNEYINGTSIDINGGLI